jgi:hypothetical protein
VKEAPIKVGVISEQTPPQSLSTILRIKAMSLPTALVLFGVSHASMAQEPLTPIHKRSAAPTAVTRPVPTQRPAPKTAVKTAPTPPAPKTAPIVVKQFGANPNPGIPSTDLGMFGGPGAPPSLPKAPQPGSPMGTVAPPLNNVP